MRSSKTGIALRKEVRSGSTRRILLPMSSLRKHYPLRYKVPMLSCSLPLVLALRGGQISSAPKTLTPLTQPWCNLLGVDFASWVTSTMLLSILFLCTSSLAAYLLRSKLKRFSLTRKKKVNNQEEKMADERNLPEYATLEAQKEFLQEAPRKGGKFEKTVAHVKEQLAKGVASVCVPGLSAEQAGVLTERFRNEPVIITTKKADYIGSQNNLVGSAVNMWVTRKSDGKPKNAA